MLGNQTVAVQMRHVLTVKGLTAVTVTRGLEETGLPVQVRTSIKANRNMLLIMPVLSQ